MNIFKTESKSTRPSGNQGKGTITTFYDDEELFQTIVLEPDQRMYRSVQKSKFSEVVMKTLREAEKLSSQEEYRLEINFENTKIKQNLTLDH